MKNFTILIMFISILFGCSNSGPYNESADAAADIQQALSQAKVTQKPVVIVFGANWCSNCRAVDAALTTGEVGEKLANGITMVKVNVGNFDTNLAVAERYGNPISGGIPGAALLSSGGKIVYVTTPGELSSLQNEGAEALYHLFKQRLKLADQVNSTPNV